MSERDDEQVLRIWRAMPDYEDIHVNIIELARRLRAEWGKNQPTQEPAALKAWCPVCNAITGSSLRNCTSTDEKKFTDLCCDTCHFIIATLAEWPRLYTAPVTSMTDEQVMQDQYNRIKDLERELADVRDALAEAESRYRINAMLAASKERTP